jgi:hypothetical protein
MGELSVPAGIIAAVLIAAVLAVRHLGGDDEFVKRAAQVFLAALLTLTAISATMAVIRLPDAPEDVSDVLFSDEEQAEEARYYIRDLGRRETERDTIQFVFAVTFAAIGAFALRRLVFLPLALMLSALFLILLVLGVPSSADIYATLLSGIENPGFEWDLARFIVITVGTALFMLFAVNRWEVPPQSEAPDGNDPPEPPPVSS